MAKCSRCGKSIGLLETICDDCKKKEIEKQRRMEAGQQAQLEQVQQEREAKLQRIAFAVGETIKKRLQAGYTIYLYETIYSSIGSVINGQTIGDEFEISTIRKLGLDGWEVVQAIPRTIGIGLTNHQVGFSAGESWGGGMGGNIAGVHILLKKVLRNIDDLNQWGKLDSYIQDHIAEFAN
jgi:hypothetical protein